VKHGDIGIRDVVCDRPVEPSVHSCVAADLTLLGGTALNSIKSAGHVFFIWMFIAWTSGSVPIS